MDTSDQKAAIRKFIDDAWNHGRWEAGQEHLADGFVNHTPFGAESANAFLARIRAFREAFPDWHMSIDAMLEDQDCVITRWTASGTHQGSFRGTAATGRRVTVTGIAIDRVVNGKRTEGWALLDMHGLLEQIVDASPTIGQHSIDPP